MKQEQRNQLAKSWSRMDHCIAHDLKTSLVAIGMVGENLEKILPELLQGYHLAVEKKLLEPKVNPKRLAMLESLIPEVGKGVNDMMNFLNIVLTCDKKLTSDATDIKTLSMHSCIEALLANYPFENKEQSLVHLDLNHDFNFQCAPLFIEHLLNNLLKNALYYIEQAQKGEVYISTEQEGDFNILRFKDTALGMGKDTQEHVFDRFFSKRDNNIVPGLGFCRLAILQLGGDIICNTEKEKYTEFLIKFPV